MTPLFDRALLDVRRRRAEAAAVPGADFLLRRAADDLAERLSAVNRRFSVALDLATPSALLARQIAASGAAGRVLRLDRLPTITGEESLAIVGDADALPFAASSLDLVVSLLALQFANDLPGIFVQVRRALRPDGLFLGAMIGGDTLEELRTALAIAEVEIRGGAAPRIGPFTALRDLGGLLQRAGFALPVVDGERVVARYDSALALIRDLRAMGATNVLRERERRPLGRAILLRAAQLYAERYADADGRVRATFEFLWFSGWAPDPGQQQPLRPGSARSRLADALGVNEQAAGEKPGRL